MTQYFDRHGTEIFLGDIVTCHCGSSSCPPGKEYAAKLLQRPENYRKYMEVVRRADGSPVYRYNGGEDVRIGDELEFLGYDRHVVTGFTKEHGDTVICVGPGQWLAPNACTLLRRADEKPSEAREVLGKDRNGRSLHAAELKSHAASCAHEKIEKLQEQVTTLEARIKKLEQALAAMPNGVRFS